MSNVTIQRKAIPPMSDQAIDMVRQIEVHVANAPQLELVTDHVIHGGMYARTVRLPAGYILTGVLIKVGTVVIVSGHVRVFLGEGYADLHGYNVLPASAGRKQVFVAYEDTDITMLMPTQAQSVEDVEAEFTDETASLMSHSMSSTNTVTITGE
jgi:hypothetical protein